MNGEAKKYNSEFKISESELVMKCLNDNHSPVYVC